MNPLNAEMKINSKAEDRCSEIRCYSHRVVRFDSFSARERGQPKATLEFTLYLVGGDCWYPLPEETIEVSLIERDKGLEMYESLEFVGRVQAANISEDAYGLRTADVIAIGRAEYTIGSDAIFPGRDNRLDFKVKADGGDKSRRDSVIAFVPETDHGYTPSKPYEAKIFTDVRTGDPVWTVGEFRLPVHFNCRCEIDTGWPEWEPDDSDFVLNWGVYAGDWLVKGPTAEEVAYGSARGGGLKGMPYSAEPYVREMAKRLAENVDREIMKAYVGKREPEPPRWGIRSHQGTQHLITDLANGEEITLS